MAQIFVDHSLTIGAPETTYALPIPPTRAYEWIESSKLDQDPATIQAMGLRQNSRFPRADRSVPGIGRATGSINCELISKTLGLFLQQGFGTATSTNVAGALFQQVFTASTSAPPMPPFTAQEGIIRTDGVIEAFTSRGCTVKSLEIAQPMTGPVAIKFDLDARGKHRFRSVVDGATTTGTKTVTSATANWGWNDVGIPISGAGITAGTTIASVESVTSMTLSANATATASSVVLSIGTAYVTPTYASGASLYTSALPTAGALTLGGTLTAPTTTALASISGGTIAVGLKSWTFNLDNGLDLKREIVGGRNNPTTGARKGTVTLQLEYDSVTGAMLADAQANGTKLAALIGSQTPEQITAGNPAQMQLAFASLRFDSGAFPQPTKGDTTVHTVKASVLDGLVAAQAAYLVLRTADTAL